MSDERMILSVALQKKTPQEREAYLEEVCGGDVELRRQVEVLLKVHENPRNSLSLPADDADVTLQRPDGDPPNRSLDQSPVMEGAGSTIGPYKLLQKIGEGGFGAVYMAEQEEPVRRRVALKIIKPGMDSREVIARFEAERQALAMMDHMNIARVLDAGTTDTGRPFFVMQLVKGVPITEYCDKNKLSIKVRLDLFMQVCHAIQHAHQKGIIHRDIKPSNVLVALYDGRPVPKVIDFGVAKAVEQRLTEKTMFTQYGQIIGTPQYMSPEQAEMNQLDIDTRSDIYSLGVLLYELLTGTTPVEREKLRGAAFNEMLRMIREDEPPKPSTRLSGSGEALATISTQRRIEPKKLTTTIRGDLDWIVMKALEKDRTRRYETASSFAADIQRHLEHEPVEAGPPSTAYKLRKFARKHRGWLTTAAAFAVILVAAAGVSTWQAVRATLAEKQAETEREIAHQAQADAEQAKEETEVALEETRIAKRATEQALAQTEKANRQTENALAQSEQSRKQAEAVAEFLVTAFRLPDPEYAGRHVTVAQVLDGSVKDLENRFTDDPLTKAALKEAIAATYLGLGLPRKAVPLLEEALELRRSKLGPTNPNTLRSMNQLAVARLEVGQIVKALAVFEEALNLTREIKGPDHPNTLTSMNNLARAYGAAGQTDKALALSEETFKLTREKLGPDNPVRLMSMNGLAGDYLDAGQTAKALPLFEETLKLMRAQVGARHPDTLTLMNNLAEAYRHDGQTEKAVALHEETLKLKREKLGSDHPDTLNSMNNLAGAYAAAGETVKRIALLEKALKVTRDKFGMDYPGTLRSMSNLALAYADAGQTQKALALQEESLKLTSEKLGDSHPSTLTSMDNLAGVYHDAGQTDKALTLFEETLKLKREKLGNDHPSTLMSMGSLATMCIHAGQTNRAIAMLEEALKLMREKLGPDHPDTLKSMNNLAGAYKAAGEIDKALALHSETLELTREKLGPIHPDTLTSMNNLAAAYSSFGQMDKALALHEETFKLTHEELGAYHPRTLASMSNLAVAYGNAGETAKAVALHKETLHLRREKLGPDHPETLNSMNNLGAAYHDAGQSGTAVPLLEDTLKLMSEKLGRDHPDTVPWARPRRRWRFMKRLSN